LEAVGRKFSHRLGNPATVRVVRWPSASEAVVYRLCRPKLTQVSLISMGTTHKQTRNHCYGDNRKMATVFTYRILVFYVIEWTDLHTHTRAFNGPFSGTTRVSQYTHTHPFNGPFSGTAQVSYYRTRKVKPMWILLKQETVSGSGIKWAIYKSASRSRPITTPAPHHSIFYRPDALPAAQPAVSKH